MHKFLNLRGTDERNMDSGGGIRYEGKGRKGYEDRMDRWIARRPGMVFGRGIVYRKGYLMHITGPSQFEGPDNVVRRAKTLLVNWWAPQ
jgi:hypothetical protein